MVRDKQLIFLVPQKFTCIFFLLLLLLLLPPLPPDQDMLPIQRSTSLAECVIRFTKLGREAHFPPLVLWYSLMAWSPGKHSETFFHVFHSTRATWLIARYRRDEDEHIGVELFLQIIEQCSSDSRPRINYNDSVIFALRWEWTLFPGP